ncbi:MAG: tyrosine-type recombinase/integrase [Bacteroidales bacterium]|nr:tyrosine-type recombinase/integrase [Bacteroidales bacterium]
MRHLGDFLEYIKNIKHYTPNTFIAYKRDLEQFFIFCESDQKYDLDALNHQQIRNWIISLMENGCSARTVNRKISSLKTFCRYLVKEGIIGTNPVARVLTPKSYKKLPVFVNEKQMNFLLDEVVFGDDFTGMRNRLIIETFYNTGIRLTELINLKTVDIYGDGSALKVTGKRNKERMIPITRDFYNDIVEYMRIRNENVAFENDDHLFLTSGGKRLYPRLVYRVVTQYLSLVTTADKKSPHILRHSFATAILNRGADLNAIKDLLGHANLSATEVYTHNTFEKLKTIYKQAHPRA